MGRKFESDAADRVWSADVMYVSSGEGRLYFAAVGDLHTRRIVGWSMSEQNDSRLVVNPL